MTFTDGQVQVRGEVSVRGKRKRADYLLYFQPNLPLAVIEAKDGTFEVSSGTSQALGYADVLDVPLPSIPTALASFSMTAPPPGPKEVFLGLEAFWTKPRGYNNWRWRLARPGAVGF